MRGDTHEGFVEGEGHRITNYLDGFGKAEFFSRKWFLGPGDVFANCVFDGWDEENGDVGVGGDELVHGG